MQVYATQSPAWVRTDSPAPFLIESNRAADPLPVRADSTSLAQYIEEHGATPPIGGMCGIGTFLVPR